MSDLAWRLLSEPRSRRAILRWLTYGALVVMALHADAQPAARVCSDPRTGRFLWSDAAVCNEVPLSSYPCDLISGLPHCEPPAATTFRRMPVPLDAPVKFAGVTTDQGRTYWTWVKAGEPSRPCTDAEASEQAHYGRACAARVGDVLMRMVPVYVP